ncbi:MAG: selenide, water dikinase SelD [Bacteroidetes bacterium]|nr:selenide, water dikinase SelD [Bacteroidota bacterium]
MNLTEFNPGSGCGCKLGPEALQCILGASGVRSSDFWPQLWVGHEHADDAAVVDLGDGRGLVQTVDFFTPIVDDPYDFGRIAATNALSDVYAMGGRPISALALLAWPVERLPAALAGRVIEGARDVCREAGIPLAGGHSIDIPEPLFGLSVSGIVGKAHLKTNSHAQPGDVLFLTKPLGLGILATATKRGTATDSDREWAIRTMLTLNDIGAELAEIPGVHSMTDVTGFGLAGHLLEVARASGLRAELDLKSVPTYDPERLRALYQQFCLPNLTTTNYRAIQAETSTMDGYTMAVLCDPQTSGGLLVFAGADAAPLVREALAVKGLCAEPIGTMHTYSEKEFRLKLS